MTLKEYYATCAVPKPQSKKKKLLYNGWKDKPNRQCFYTGQYGAERHEIFGGPNRQKSIRYGLQLDLCHEIHRRVTEAKTPEDIALRQSMYEMGQRKFENMLMEEEGYSDVEARKRFMLEFGRNYLDMLGKEDV